MANNMYAYQDESERVSAWMLIALFGVSVILGFGMMPANQTFHDESFHMPQILAYLKHQYLHLEKSLTMIPGYHFLVATISHLFGWDTVNQIRNASILLSLPAIAVFFLLARSLGHRSPVVSTSLFYFSPIFFPFFYVLYTDVPSLLFVLLGMWALHKRYYSAAAVIFFLSMLLRQTNVIWLVMAWGIALFYEWSTVRYRYDLYRYGLALINAGLKTFLFPVFCLAFLLFVYFNGGVAIGDSTAHKLDRVYVTQVYFWLLTVFVLFLPLHIKNIPAILRLLKERSELILLCSALLVLYMATFWAEHGYNYFDFFLRNRVVQWMRADELHRLVLFFPMLWAFLSLVVTPLREKRFYLLYPFTVLSLIPHSLVDQRYFMESIALFILFKKDDSHWVNVFTLAIYLPIIAFLYFGISQIRFFL